MMLDQSAGPSQAASSRPFQLTGRRRLLPIVVAAILSMGMLSGAQAIPSGLDPTFGAQGRSFTDFFGNNDYAYDLALQPDGKLIAVGETYDQTGDHKFFAVARYNVNGSLDTSFGNGGKVTTAFTDVCAARSVAIQPDGKIVVAGHTQVDVNGEPSRNISALARYNTDGSLDTSFNSDGKTIADFTGTEGTVIGLQPDGGIILVLSHVTSQEKTDFLLARYLPDGSRDRSFGRNGRVITSFGLGGRTSPRAIVVRPDGKILVAGFAFYGTSSKSDFAVARYNPNGSLDSSFGGDGKVTTDFFGSTNNAGDFATGIALQPDGRILVSGYAANGEYVGVPLFDFALVRYHADGSLDTSFDGDGKVTTDLRGRDFAFDMALQPDGKIVLGGVTNAERGSVFPRLDDLALVRYNTDGSLDTGFGEGGSVVTDLSCGSDRATAMALQPDGKIAVVGYNDNTPGTIDFVLARYPLRATSSAPKLSAISSYPPKITGTENTIGQIILCSAAPPDGVVVPLSSNNPAISVPPSITIRGGTNYGAFLITTSAVTKIVSGNVSARLGGITKSAQLIVKPIGVDTLLMLEGYVHGPDIVIGLVYLDAPAPAGGITVTLSSRNPAIASPKRRTIFIPVGKQSAYFEIQAHDVPAERTAIITATANGISKSAHLRVN